MSTYNIDPRTWKYADPKCLHFKVRNICGKLQYEPVCDRAKLWADCHNLVVFPPRYLDLMQTLGMKLKTHPSSLSHEEILESEFNHEKA